MSIKSNETKKNFLGMPIGTASGRLKKKVMLYLLQKLGENKCYRCNKEIETPEELSVEHKKYWLHIDKKLFWDLDNITFSHMKCNTKAKRCPHKIEDVPGMYWCGRCKQYKFKDCFPSCKKHLRTHYCTLCSSKLKKEYRKRTRKR